MAFGQRRWYGELSLVVAVTQQRDGCILVHTDAALKAGVTKEELVEALGAAVAVNGGAALVYSARTLEPSPRRPRWRRAVI